MGKNKNAYSSTEGHASRRGNQESPDQRTEARIRACAVPVFDCLIEVPPVMDKADIWMPIYIGDYLADTSRLTTEQHGAYFLLMMDYWRNGAPPDDDAVLAQITRLSADAWSIAQAVLKNCFTIENGLWIHKRIEAELLKAKSGKEKAQIRAKAGAAARWSKANDMATDAISNASSMQQAMLDSCPSPSPSPISITNSKELVVFSAAEDLPTEPEKLDKPDCPHQDIIALYHEVLPQCPRIRDWTPARAIQLRARWNEDKLRQTPAYWRELFEYVASCDFLVGRSGKTPFFADLAWMTKSENFTKIREGKYENRGNA